MPAPHVHALATRLLRPGSGSSFDPYQHPDRCVPKHVACARPARGFLRGATLSLGPECLAPALSQGCRTSIAVHKAASAAQRALRSPDVRHLQLCPAQSMGTALGDWMTEQTAASGHVEGAWACVVVPGSA